MLIVVLETLLQSTMGGVDIVGINKDSVSFFPINAAVQALLMTQKAILYGAILLVSVPTLKAT